MTSPTTLQQMVDSKVGLTGNCAHPYCGKGRFLDMQALIKWLGPDHQPFVEKRIAQAFKCGAEGHRGGIIHLQANTEPRSNAYAKAKGR